METEKNWKEYCLNPDEFSTRNKIDFLSGAEEAFFSIIERLKSARKFAFIEVYSFSDDHIGKIFSDILIKKAAQGVKIRIIYDSVGSISTGGNFFKKMEKNGILVKEYHQAVPWKPYWTVFRRDHRKLFCIDGETAFVGGFNITEYAAPESMGGRGWKDSMVEIKGSIVRKIERQFLSSWLSCGGKSDDVFFSPEKKDETINGKDLNMRAAAVSASGIRNMMSIRRSYKYAIEKAKENIFITNAYFLPDRFIYRKLIKAAKRGVDVRIIAPFNTDHPYVRWASWALYAKIKKKGIKIYEWQGSILHSKTAVIDGIWSSVGSHNLDHRSLYYNLELNINVFDKNFGEVMRKMFFFDLKGSRAISLDDCAKRSFLSKTASKILYFFRAVL